nr:uncharacterized protein LOC109425599 [Aedes albopictus]
MGKVRYRCCVPGCLARSLKGNQGNETFFRCPDPDRYSSPYLQSQAKLRLEAWRKVISESLSSTNRICSRHFLSGRPSQLIYTTAVDWTPVLMLPMQRNISEQSNTVECYDNTVASATVSRANCFSQTDPAPPSTEEALPFGDTYDRSDAYPNSAANKTSDDYQLMVPAASSDGTLSCTNVDADVHNRPISEEMDLCNADASFSSSDYTLSCDGDDLLPVDDQIPCESSSGVALKVEKKQTRHIAVQAAPLVRSRATQTAPNENAAQKVKILETVIDQQNTEINCLEERLRRTKVDLRSLRERPQDIKYYTGLDRYYVVEILFRSIEPYMLAPINMSKEQVFLMTLQKMRFGFFYKSLSIAYEVCPATTSKYFLSTIYTLYTVFHNLVHWPSRDTLKQHTPQCFRDAFGTETTVIIDCFEIRGERSSNPIAAAQQWSDYKKGNTCKYLIGISPTGSVIFISKGYGGRASDKHITTTCGFLEKLCDGDVVMADRGFLIEGEIKKKNARLNIPAFKKMECNFQLSTWKAHVRLQLSESTLNE